MNDRDDWNGRIVMLSVHPDAASRDDVARLAADLMEARRLLVAAVPWLGEFWGSASSVHPPDPDGWAEWFDAVRDLTR